MRVWHRAPGPPPLGPADRDDVPCSLSPTSPEVQAANFVNTDHYHPWTHIIRTAVDPAICDNYLRGDETTLWPISMFEIPQDSGHYYICLWAHQVGAGFPNWHARIYVCRYNLGHLADLPWFTGYI